jgi:hypothetical protein
LIMKGENLIQTRFYSCVSHVNHILVFRRIIARG